MAVNLSSKTEEYASKLYTFMEESAVKGENGLLVWTGHLTQVSAGLQIPLGSHPRLIRRMHELGCIDVFVRGTTMRESQVALLKHPNDVNWVEKRRSSRSLTDDPAFATLSQRVENLQRQLPGGLNIAQALLELQGEITALQERVDILERERGKPDGKDT